MTKFKKSMKFNHLSNDVCKVMGKANMKENFLFILGCLKFNARLDKKILLVLTNQNLLFCISTKYILPKMLSNYLTPTPDPI